MTRQESVQLFNEVKEYLQSNGFTTPNMGGGENDKYNFRGKYMLFNCPHMCSSVRLFDISNGRRLVEDIRTSFGKPLEDNRLLTFNFINKVIQRLNDEDREDNTVQG